MPDFTPYQPNKADHHPGSSIPQWRQENAIYFITFRLADSLPKSVIRDWDRRRRIWLIEHLEVDTATSLSTNVNDPLSLNVNAAVEALGDANRESFQRKFTAEWHDFLDAGYGQCQLRNPQIRQHVADSLLHFDQDRYDLYSSVIMPNHIHALVKPTSQNLSSIISGWKSFTARQINKQLKRTGSLWMRESYNRIIRTENSFQKFQRYILNNPSKAKLPVDTYTILKSE